MRTLVDIDDDDVAKLDALAGQGKVSRAALVRQAIADFLSRKSSGAEKDAFGLWGKRKTDGLAFQRKLRAEW